jgi:hypothetical protein
MQIELYHFISKQVREPADIYWHNDLYADFFREPAGEAWKGVQCQTTATNYKSACKLEKEYNAWKGVYAENWLLGFNHIQHVSGKKYTNYTE